MNPLKKRVIDFFYVRELKKHRRNRMKFSYSNVESVGIVFDGTDDTEYKRVMSLVQKLEVASSRVSILAYMPKNRAVEKFYDFKFFTDDDINWFGKARSKRLLSFIDTPYSLLINFFDNPNYAVKFLVTSSSAKFKVGKYNSDETLQMHDLAIKIDDSKKFDFVEEAIKYLKLMK